MGLGGLFWVMVVHQAPVQSSFAPRLIPPSLWDPPLCPPGGGGSVAAAGAPGAGTCGRRCRAARASGTSPSPGCGGAGETEPADTQTVTSVRPSINSRANPFCQLRRHFPLPLLPAILQLHLPVIPNATEGFNTLPGVFSAAGCPGHCASSGTTSSTRTSTSQFGGPLGARGDPATAVDQTDGSCNQADPIHDSHACA